MADIYVVYTGDDREHARRIVEGLRPRWTVWWDADLVGRYPQVIEREMPLSGCVVLVNSARVRDQDHVIEELRLAKEAGKTIIPARLDDAKPPYGFGTYSGSKIEGWTGEDDHEGWRLLQHKISQIVPPREKPRRPVSILNGRLALPGVFMSVSSHETQVSPEDAVRLAKTFGCRTVLTSAYDWAHGRVTSKRTTALAQLHRSGALIFMDSGNYEAQRRADKTWTPKHYAETLKTAPHDVACAFDVLPAPKDPVKAFDALVAGVERDAGFTSAPIVPIVHCPRLPGGGYDLQHLPKLMHDLALELKPPLLAVPERELGAGLIERAREMRRLRQALDALPFYQPVHLLGTGNPWSIAALAAAGADSFDGLEWCRVVVDRDTNRLNHFQHYDLFAGQSAVSAVTRAAVAENGFPFAVRAALHNLDYYDDLTRQLQSYAAKGGMETLVTGLLGGPNTRQLAEQAGLFK